MRAVKRHNTIFNRVTSIIIQVYHKLLRLLLKQMEYEVIEA